MSDDTKNTEGGALEIKEAYQNLVPYLDDEVKKAMAARTVEPGPSTPEETKPSGYISQDQLLQVRYVGVRCVQKPGVEEYKKLAKALKETHEKYGIKGHLVKAIEIPMVDTVTVVKDGKPEEVTNEIKAMLLSYILLDAESAKKFDADVNHRGLVEF